MNDPSAKERRVYPRLPRKQQMLITGIDAEHLKKSAETSTMGLGGCAFELDEELPPGTLLKLLLALDLKVVKATARVVYSKPVADGRYEIGAQFIDISPEDRSEITRLFEQEPSRLLSHEAQQLAIRLVELVKSYRGSTPKITFRDCIDALRVVAQKLTEDENQED